VRVPSWRGDVEGMADLAEEVGRFYSYNKIEPTLFAGGTQPGGLTERQQLERAAGMTLRGMGYSEILTYSFISPVSYDKLRIPADCALRDGPVILNPLGEDTSVMRTSMLPSMLDSLGRNKSVKNDNVKLYEISKVYHNTEKGQLPDERTMVILGAYGQTDFFEMKGAVEALLQSLRVQDAVFTAQEENPAYHPGRCAEISAGGHVIGVLGQIHPKVADAWGLGETYVAELDFALLLQARAPEGKYVPLPKYPTVQRDLAVVCDEAVTIAQLTTCIRKAGGALLKEVTLFDIYTGSHIPEGKKSTAFSLKLRAEDRTLTDADSDAVMAAILAALKEELGAVIR
jgi:phenylalanyl-tRNA synthetase beta chain